MTITASSLQWLDFLVAGQNMEGSRRKIVLTSLSLTLPLCSHNTYFARVGAQLKTFKTYDTSDVFP